MSERYVILNKRSLEKLTLMSKIIGLVADNLSQIYGILKSSWRRVSRYKVDQNALSRLRKYGSHNAQTKEFHEFWQECKRHFPVDIAHTPALDKPVELFNEHGVTSWMTESSKEIAEQIGKRIKDKEKSDPTVWSDQMRFNRDILGEFPELENIFHDSLSEFFFRVYGTSYKIFYGVLYKSIGSGTPWSGSALWHRDGGPGTCINVMYGISAVSKENDSLMCISKRHTLELTKRQFLNARKHLNNRYIDNSIDAISMDRRQVTSNYIAEILENEVGYSVIQPTGGAGLIIPFLNNNFHRGGHPKFGQSRYVCVFHVYPSKDPVDWDEYRRNGIIKTASYPEYPSQKF